MRPDVEAELRGRIRSGIKPRDAIAELLAEGRINHPKQAWRTLEKWCRQGTYEYGVSLDLGWLTEGDSEDR